MRLVVVLAVVLFFVALSGAIVATAQTNLLPHTVDFQLHPSYYPLLRR
jgi:hypothetical protein